MPYEDQHPRPSHRPQRAGSGGIPDGLLLGVLGLLLGLSVFTWTATGLAGLFAHGGWPENVTFGNTPNAIRELVTEPHDLVAAWPATPKDQLSGYGLFWGVFISQFMVLLVLTIFVMGTVARARAVRRARRLATRQAAEGRAAEGHGPAASDQKTDPRHAPGHGTENHTAGHPGVEQAPGSAAGTARTPPGAPSERPAPAAPPPSAEQPPTAPQQPVTPAAPTATGTPLADPAPAAGTAAAAGGAFAAGAFAGGAAGRTSDASGTGVGASPEDRITQVLEAPGAALVTSADPALWAATKSARAKLGPVHLFDPTHACDTPDRLRWSPHHGCADRATATARATAFLAPLRSPRPIDATTHATAETVLRCWLHAAALENRPFREVHRWALAAQSASDPVRTLRTHPKATAGSAGELEAVLTGHPQLRADAVALIRRALTPLDTLHIRNACSAERADRVALESFIAETGTLYVVGEDPDVLPILHALTQSVVEHGRRMAARSSAGRLDPPLTTILTLDSGPAL